MITQPNGLRLLVKPNHSSEIVAIDCLVRVKAKAGAVAHRNTGA